MNIRLKFVPSNRSEVLRYAAGWLLVIVMVPVAIEVFLAWAEPKRLAAQQRYEAMLAANSADMQAPQPLPVAQPAVSSCEKFRQEVIDAATIDGGVPIRVFADFVRACREQPVKPRNVRITAINGKPVIKVPPTKK
jgi:hypothetical protein